MNILDKPLSELKNALGTDFEKGLDANGVKNNTEAFGDNSLFDKESDSASSFFKALLSDVMPWLFIALCVLSLFLKRFGYVVPCLILFSVYVIIRFGIHYSLSVIDRQIGAYRKIYTTVIRNGQRKRINAQFLVPGDILILGKGDFVPCDCIVINSQDFSVYESYITSNPDAIPKKSQHHISPDGEPYHHCILFTGSVVFEGEAKVLVCNT
ncbi:MAG: cation-transporting P-type ATPase, partial [Clostridia bacterium]|nr:cation-transporting P-type ATPase [Clostridia bacterium]